MTISKIAYFVLAVCTLTSYAHTWVTCVNQQGNNCRGFIRNYRGRNTPNGDVDNFYTHKLLGRSNNFPLCKDTQNSKTSYTQQYPMTSARAGETINIMYTPNGHSQPGDWGLQTTSRIHWTGTPNTELRTRGDLNDGNRLASWNYGSNCATSGDVASLPCTNGFRIPEGIQSGIYSFYYYWPYDSNQRQVPIGEEYYSCFEVNVTGVAAAPSTSNTPTPTSTSTSRSTSNTPTQAISQSTSNGNGVASSASDVCGSYLTECQSFCAPASASVCECDPQTGRKTVRCGEAGETSSALRTVAGLSAIFAIAQLL